MNDWITEEIKAQIRELNAVRPMGHKYAVGGLIKEKDDDDQQGKILKFVVDSTHYLRDRKSR